MKRLPYIIERNVPLPPHGGRKGRPYSALSRAVQALKVGESFLVTDRARSTVEKAARKYIGAGKYETRAEGRGTRVWRLTK